MKPDRDEKVLTWRENKIFTYVRDFIGDRGYAPSIREITGASGLSSTSSVNYVLGRLQDKGYLHRISGRQAVAIAGQVMVSREDLREVLADDGWASLGMDGSPGYERLRKAAGLT